MKVHHLNCGTMREIDPGAAAPLKPARALNHCLLVETDEAGLVLVETGFGTLDVERHGDTLGRTFLDHTQVVLDPGETAVRQIAGLGLDLADVRHIVLTHLDLDHTGGLPDFPDATVHVHDAELRTAMAVSGHPEHALRYRPAHWAHRPRWSTYTAQKGNAWFGFDAIELAGLPPEILLIPLAGHTPGHCAVAYGRGTGGCCTPATRTTTTARSRRTAGRCRCGRPWRRSARRTVLCAWPTRPACANCCASTAGRSRSSRPTTRGRTPVS